ncbi:MAG: FkbM family methyltransferase [Methylovulum sp.]
MSFISYAQNFEDVMLWRALKHVQNGVYVDVGAQHPVIDSVSKAFYARGWRGVHIEPVPQYAELLRQDRPDEVVLQVALSDSEGTLELNVIPETGLSTAVDDYAQRHLNERGFQSQRIHVPVLTLTSALQSLVGKDVHWLKIDVEGLEEKVLKGWNSQLLRPWIMVVEATIPNSPVTDFMSWDAILTNAQYRFVYFDGLNRFYIAEEHAELAEAFTCPPNVFDNIEVTASSMLCSGVVASHKAIEKLAEELSAANENNIQLQAHIEKLAEELKMDNEGSAQLQAHIEILAEELNMANEGNTQLQAYAEHLQKELNRSNDEVNKLVREQQLIYSSKSWLITLPLRKGRQIAGLLLGPAKKIVKSMLVRTMRYVLVNRQLTATALSLLGKFPELKQRLRLLAMRSGLLANRSVQYTQQHTKEASINNLSSRANLIYADLQRAIDIRK